MTARSLGGAARALAAALALPPLAAAADPVLEWNETAVHTMAGQNPFAQARFAAITQIAVFEAVNAVTRDYEPYLVTIEAPAGASPEAAAVAAAHGVLTVYFPAQAASLAAARDASLASIPAGPPRDQGLAVGAAAAAALVAARADDGSAPPAFHLPGSADAGVWQLTPSCPAAGGILLHWRDVAPFGIRSAREFRSEPPPPLESRRYARDFEEVKEVGAADSPSRPAGRAEVARFYNAASAVAVWNPALRQVAAARGRSLAWNARAFALLNIAISDALVAVMETKYRYLFWRPETAIREAAEDRNSSTEPDATFVPYIATPCFPGYGSAHAAASHAARRVAEALFGNGCVSVTLVTPTLPGVVLPYDSFEAITDDVDDARVYGGIHFRFDQRAGGRQGRRIGDFVLRHRLRPASWKGSR
jgi:hypothetical protein